MTPRTAEGKIVTMLYALIGVPLMLMCLSSLGGFLAEALQCAYTKLCGTSERQRDRQRQHSREHNGHDTDDNGVNDEHSNKRLNKRQLKKQHKDEVILLLFFGFFIYIFHSFSSFSFLLGG